MKFLGKSGVLLETKILQEQPFEIKYRTEPEWIHRIKPPWTSPPPPPLLSLKSSCTMMMMTTRTYYKVNVSLYP
jgi:hypothetical protein